MPITYPEEGVARAVFAGRCVPEEADALLEWLRRSPEPQADFGQCTDLHTALAQLLLASATAIAAPPPDALLAACLAAHLPVLPQPAVPKPTRRGRRTRRAAEDEKTP